MKTKELAGERRVTKDLKKFVIEVNKPGVKKGCRFAMKGVPIGPNLRRKRGSGMLI